MPNVPQHPARQQGQPQQGLNPYHKPNPGLQAMETAQIQAQTNKTLAEDRAVKQGLNPDVTPQQVQAQQLAEGLLNGQAIPEGVHPAIAEAAMGMAQAKEQQAMQQYAQSQAQGQGLGGF